MKSNRLNIQELPIDEIYKRYGVIVDKESLGFDRSIFFDSIALKLNKISTKIEYLPSGYSPYKEYDIIIKVKGV